MARATQEAIECTQDFLRRMRKKGYTAHEITIIVITEACPEMLEFFDDIERTIAQMKARS